MVRSQVYPGVVGLVRLQRSSIHEAMPPGGDPKMRLGQIALAVALILIVKLIDWRNRYQPT